MSSDSWKELSSAVEKMRKCRRCFSAVWSSAAWLLQHILGLAKEFRREECFQQEKWRGIMLLENVLNHRRNFQ